MKEDCQNKTNLGTVKHIIPIVMSPLFLILVWHVNVRLSGSLGALVYEISKRGFTGTMGEIFGPVFFGSSTAWKMIAVYTGLQLVLMKVLPGKVFEGPTTPMGETPQYKANGFPAFLVTIGLFLGGSFGLGFFSPGIIYDHFGDLIGATNCFAVLLCLLLYFKGRIAPSSRDRKITGNFLSDYYLGTELYPRILGWDVKLFTNCRFGIMAWCLIVLSCAAKQMELYGLSDSMFVSILLQFIIVAKFFFWETDYLKTIDIIHDNAGFYLCWGCMVWIPFFYTSAAVYLVQHPNHLGTVPAMLIFGLGLASMFCVFVADQQRHRVRTTQGRTTIWGKPAEFIVGNYVDKNGEKRSNLLLVSGFWGVARHFHYFPEVLEGFFWTVPVLLGSVVPYFYIVFVSALLMARASRDDKRCAAKYGADWDEYCRRVPYKVFPGVV